MKYIRKEKSRFHDSNQSDYVGKPKKPSLRIYRKCLGVCGKSYEFDHPTHRLCDHCASMNHD